MAYLKYSQSSALVNCRVASDPTSSIRGADDRLTVKSMIRLA